MNQWFVVTQIQICLHQPTDVGERNSGNEKIKKEKTVLTFQTFYCD